MMMKLLLLIAAVIVATVMADECDKLERLMVKQEWANLYKHGRERESFNTDLWKEFFRLKPDAVAKFERVHGDNLYSPSMRAHMARVNTGLDQCLSLLDDQAVLDAQMAHLKDQHATLGVGADMFEAFGKALLEVASHDNGMCFDQDAWSHCYNMVAKGITG